MKRKDYSKEWRSYRRRFRFTAAAWALPPVLIYLSRIGGRLWTMMVVAWLLTFTASMVWLFSFRCPRCREWFFIQFPTNHPLTKVCVHCGLPKYADPDQTELVK